MRIVAAQGDILEQILDATWPLWNQGLTRDAYGRWNAAQMRTVWGAAHLQRLALIDEAGEWVASAKRYRFPARLDGRDGTMCGIGAVFTRPDQRGRGHAAALIEQMVALERHEGTLLAALFSDIGEAYYRRLGFEPVPLSEVTIEVIRKGGSPAMLVRAGDERDLPNVAAMHDVRAGSARFALRRDSPLVHYALSKQRMLAGLGPSGVRQVEFFVAEEGSSAVAYVVLSVSEHMWTIEEAGDRDPAGARLGAILQVLLAREPSDRVPLIRAWWPAAFPVPPQIRMSTTTPTRERFMMRSLTELTLPATGDEVFYWHGDHF